VQWGASRLVEWADFSVVALHELSTKQEIDTAAHVSHPFSSAFVPWGGGWAGAGGGVERVLL
jgi:hypothetical protein